MTVSDFKDLAEIASSLATVVAFVLGGVWTYLLFVQNRERFPRAALSQEVSSFALDDHWRVVRVCIHVQNAGKVLLPIRRVECRLLQVLPLAGSLASKTSDPMALIESGKRRIPWPMLDDRVWTHAVGEVALEPGETETLRCDFVIENSTRVVQIYSYVENVTKKVIGWSCLSHTELGG